MTGPERPRPVIKFLCKNFRWGARDSFKIMKLKHLEPEASKETIDKLAELDVKFEWEGGKQRWQFEEPAMSHKFSI